MNQDVQNDCHKKRCVVTSRTIREEYPGKTCLTLAEAGALAGVKPKTIGLWLRKGMVKRARQVGPYVVDHESLLKYLSDGKGCV